MRFFPANFYHIFHYKVFFRKSSTVAVNIKDALLLNNLNEEIVVQGWVHSIRKHKNLSFIDITDGSCANKLQIVIEEDEKNTPEYGSSIKAIGKLIKCKNKKQVAELQCRSIEKIGPCPDDYPFCNRSVYTTEYIRQFHHFRSRLKTFDSISSVRSCAFHAVHNFFREKGYRFVNTPIITKDDCEDTGEIFTVKTKKNENDNKPKEAASMLMSLLSLFKANSIPESNEDYFDVPVYLTGSGQLHLEALVCGLSKVYTFGPTFRTEGANSRVHASEFQMIEAELAFTESLDDLTKIVEQAIKHVAQSIINECEDEYSWINTKYTPERKDSIYQVINKPFANMPYSEAVKVLQSKSFNIKLGEDFSSEFKHAIVEHCNNTPVCITMMPASISPYYMKADEKGMAYCFDILAPFGGEICSGSLREDSYDVLKDKLKERNLEESLSWYLDLRKYGSVPHGGFGIGFDRLLQTLLGIPNIRDVIPFPRRKHDCKI